MGATIHDFEPRSKPLDEETRAELREMTRAAFSTIRATSRDLLAASGLLGGPDPARHMTSSEYADSQWENLGF